MPSPDALIALGATGLFISAFLAGSVLPFPSEAVLVGLMLTGQKAPLLVGVGTIGNTLGALTVYALGVAVRTKSQGRLATYAKRWRDGDAKRLARWRPVVERYGALALLFAWLPGVGDVLVFAAGALGVQLVPTALFVSLGKGARYAVVASVALAAS